MEKALVGASSSTIFSQSHFPNCRGRNRGHSLHIRCAFANQGKDSAEGNNARQGANNNNNNNNVRQQPRPNLGDNKIIFTKRNASGASRAANENWDDDDDDDDEGGDVASQISGKSRGEIFLERAMVARTPVTREAASAAFNARKERAKKREKMSVVVQRRDAPCCYGCGALLQSAANDAPGFVPLATYELVRRCGFLRFVVVVCGGCWSGADVCGGVKSPGSLCKVLGQGLGFMGLSGIWCNVGQFQISRMEMFQVVPCN